MEVTSNAAASSHTDPAKENYNSGTAPDPFSRQMIAEYYWIERQNSALTNSKKNSC